jgi:hypothetical protein
MIAVSPDGSRAVQAYMYSCRLEVYDARLNHERSVAAPFDVRLSYHVRDNAATGLALFKHLPDTKLCYIDVEATGNGFIGLFAGRDVGDMPRHEADQLHVYSWDGRLIQLVRTEEPLQSIAAVPNGSAIWAFVPGANPRFAKYDLKWH